MSQANLRRMVAETIVHCRPMHCRTRTVRSTL